MPRQAAYVVENSFVKGLITEATSLNFPENASTETYDCVFSEKGHVTRRLGFDYERDAEFDALPFDNPAISEYVWSSAGTDGTADLAVVQVGETLYFYLTDPEDSLSSGFLVDTVDVGTFQSLGTTGLAQIACQFTSGSGYLFVTNPICDPFYVEFDPDTLQVDPTRITIKCRDFEGDKADANYNNIDTRPSTLSVPHRYNLFNQGWWQDVRISGGGIVNPVDRWDTQRADFPSMADFWWLFKDASGDYLPTALFPDTFALGNTPAPKGHYILEEFDTDRETLSGLSPVTERDSGGQRPSTCVFFASRIWYAGVTAQEYSQKIYFSQIIDSTEQFGKCYQANDPTSSEISDLLPTDGGVIIIPDVGHVIKLFAMANSVIVFGTNGVWAIGGSEGVGFKTTDYAIRKISSVESLSATSFVDVYGQPVWWNTDGIYTIGSSELSGTENVQSLTDTTIKDFMLEIPTLSKTYAKGAFNPRTKIVQWIYRSTPSSTVAQQFTYDRVLNFNMISKAFYPWTITQPNDGPRIHGVVVTQGPPAEGLERIVIDSDGNTVIDSNGDTVVITDFDSVADTHDFRYLTTVEDGLDFNFTWSQSKSDEYLDWETDGHDVDYNSYFFTGYKIHGDAIRFMEQNYLTVYMLTEDDASAFVQAIWDYANTDESARYTQPQQIYRTRTNRNFQQARLKVRGRGRSVHLKFYSETGKPFDIHGWSAWETVNANV